MQYSVFHCWLTHRERGRLTEVLRRTIDTRVDDVRIYSLAPATAIHYQGPAPLPSGLIIDGLVMLPMLPDMALNWAEAVASAV